MIGISLAAAYPFIATAGQPPIHLNLLKTQTSRMDRNHLCAGGDLYRNLSIGILSSPAKEMLFAFGNYASSFTREDRDLAAVLTLQQAAHLHI